ncbi:MAG TPA: NAD(P)-dependent oxidoreductase [Pyrinomonadaceae bacterium]|jgi:nucleoside-diphosphate-sugar epimerase|nr:NAD(P)-dependent oxidoreductase [Pyrinomonadaceae bacterium]
MRVFMTGATGVVGRRVIPQLIAAGHRVTGVARTPAKRQHLERAGATAADVNLFDADSVRRALAGYDAVINLATHMPSSSWQIFLPGAWKENDRLRRGASANLVGAAIACGVTKFIQESFAPIYPDRGDDWIDESAPLRPVRYNRTVLDAENAAGRFTASGRVGVVLRFALFYGADGNFTREMIDMVRRGLAPMPGPPQSFISSVSHDDAASAVVAALRVGAGVYNVADDEPLRRREFFDSLAASLGVKPPVIAPKWFAYLAGSLGEMFARSLRISNRKLRAESVWRPKYASAREGWRAVVEEVNETALAA